MKRLFLLFFLVTGAAFGQGAQRMSVVSNSLGQPIAGASIWVCAGGATVLNPIPSPPTQPCNTLATIYSNPTLVTTITQPLTSDGLGNYIYYANPGTYIEIIVGQNINGYSTTLVLPCVVGGSGCSGGGGGGSPGAPVNSNQVNVNGSLGSVSIVSPNGCTVFGVDNAAVPTNECIPFSESTRGPRPRVDVTAYGAKGDGTDDTAGIQAAINAACAGNPTGYGTVFFPSPPSNSYNVSQPQTPSTAPVFTTCAGLHLQGANGNHAGAQFTYAPGVQISVLSGLGGSPNDAPVFTSNNNMTYENLVIRANNQAFQVGCATCAGLTGVMFKNVTGTILNTGHANNVFYYVSNTLGDHWEDSAAQVGSTQYIWGFDDTVGSQPVGLIFIDGGTYVGCPIKYTNNATQTASGPGAWFIRNLWGEVCNLDLISITNPSALNFPLISNIHLDNFAVADSSCNTCAIINLNSTGTTLSNVTIANSTVGNGGQGVAIRNTAGTVRDWHVEGANVGESVDVNGFPLASGTGTNSNGGRDFIANTSDPSRMNSFWSVAQAAGPMSRYFAGGNSVSGLAIDPTGVFFNDATNRGYNAAIQQGIREALDVSFAQSLAPTGVAGSATTGGSLAANTYFAWVSTTSDNCTTISATSLPSSGVVVGGANNAITVTWTLPPTTVLTPAGYCVSLSTSIANLPVGQIFVSGAAITSTTINTIPGGQTQIAYNTFSAVHRFLPKGLNLSGGVNFYADTGAANAYVVTTSPNLNSLPTGIVINFQATNANTTTATLNVDGIGAKVIKKNGGTGGSVGANLASGDIAAGQIVTVMYDGTNWQMQSTLGNVSGGGSGTVGNCNNSPALAYYAGNGTTTSCIGEAMATQYLYAADSGAVNAYVTTPTPALTALTTGVIIAFTTANANTAAATLNVSALGVKNLTKFGASALVAGDILASTLYLAEYDGTRWQLLNPSAPCPTCVVNNAANTGTAAFTIDASLSTSANALKLPTQAGSAPTAAASTDFDSTNNQMVYGDGTLTVPVGKHQVNSQSGAGYTILPGDLGKLITVSNGGAEIINLPASVPGKGWYVDIENTGVGTWSLAPNGHNLDGSSVSVALTTNQGIRVFSDGTNYFSQRGVGGSGGGSGTITPASQFSVGTYSLPGTGSTIVGSAAPVSPDSVPQYFIETPTGGAATAETFAPAGVVLRAVAGTSDTILVTDRAGIVVYSSASAVAVTLPQAGSAGFASSFVVRIFVTGAGLVTVTPTTSTINGAATQTIGLNDFCTIYSDNTNYTSTCTNGNGVNPVPVDTGAVNAYVLAYPLIESLQKGATIWFTVANNNTGASTINVNGLGVKNLMTKGATALVASNIITTQIYLAIYDGTEWLLLNPTNCAMGALSAHQFLGNSTGSTAACVATLIGSADSGPPVFAVDTGAGGANVYTINPSPAIPALAAGDVVSFTTANANSGASTLNVSGLGAKALDKKGSTALASGDIIAAAIYFAIYDGTEWQLINPTSGAGGSGTVNNCTVANSAAYYAGSGTAVSCLSESGLTQYLYAADSGAANAYVVNLAPALTALTTGVVVHFTTANANSGASTVNVSALGVKNITKKGTTALISGDILANAMYEILWDGTEWQLLNPSSAGAGTVTSIATTSPITGGTIVGSGTIACATCVVASSPGAGIAHFAGSTQTVTSSAVVGADMANATVTATQLAAQYSKFECSPGLGDGLNAIPAGTYLQFNCVNKSGVTWTISGINCWTDNNGTSTLNAANNAATALLTGAVTCNNTKSGGGASGTQSATVTLANNDAISFTFVSDGISKQTTFTVLLTQ